MNLANSVKVAVLLAATPCATPALAAPAARVPAGKPVALRAPGPSRAPVLRSLAPLRSLAVLPPAVRLAERGQAQALLVSGISAGDTRRDVTPACRFRSLNPRVVTVGADGIVRAVADGAATLEVRSGTLSAFVPVRVRGTAAHRPLNFANDILPVLGRAGCNQAACHAKQGGKNGFQLSVLAFDPEADYSAIVRQGHGRRLNRLEPGRSLLLQKATLSIPHAGGQRFPVDSPEYRLLARWISEGARYTGDGDPTLTAVEVDPRERVLAGGASQRLLVTAVYSDGSRRDVTRLAQYRSNEAGIAEVGDEGEVHASPLSGEAAVMARYMGQVAVARFLIPRAGTLPAGALAAQPRRNFIDELVYRKLAQLNVPPSDLCDDATFLRRSSLDLIGTLPAPEETRRFLAECEAERKGSGPAVRAREALVDRLLARGEYADYWAMRWSNLLLVNPDLLLPRGAFAFDRWLRDAFRENMPFDRFAREILTSAGDSYREGPPNFFRALPVPGDAGKAVSQLFLGVRLDCAQCHHHPFERWGQDDFYSLAAYFARVKSKSSYPEGYHSIIYVGGEGEVQHPKTGKVMPPRPLGGAADLAPAPEDRREALVRWMTAPENPFFARALVNRMWGLLMGRGLVEPVDDFRLTNPATNEPLLEALAKEFTEHGYDLKHLLRTIALSAAYQRSSSTLLANQDDTRNYSHAYSRRLPAEVLLDAVGQVAGAPDGFHGYPEATRAIQIWDSRYAVEFLDIFGRPGRQSVCECERSNDGSVTQMLHLMNSGEMQERLSKEGGTAAVWAQSGKSPEETIEQVYLLAYCRRPSPVELQAAQAAFTRPKVTRRAAIEDLLWAVLNSPEFLLNH